MGAEGWKQEAAEDGTVREMEDRGEEGAMRDDRNRFKAALLTGVQTLPLRTQSNHRPSGHCEDQGGNFQRLSSRKSETKTNKVNQS